MPSFLEMWKTENNFKRIKELLWVLTQTDSQSHIGERMPCTNTD